MNLECSSRGDKRFSAFYARLKVGGIERSIEEHYQLSKRGNFPVPKTWRDGKGKRPTHFVVCDHEYSMDLFSDWYEALWLVYLCLNPDLLAYINKYDTFSDMFKTRNTLNCQADVIQKVHDKGILKCIDENKFMNKLREGSV